MTITNAYASLAVRDLDAARPFYETLLGPGARPREEVLQWNLTADGGLQVYALPERAGNGSCTLVVRDIEEVVRRLESIDALGASTVTHEPTMDVLMVRDPDGNSLAFTELR